VQLESYLKDLPPSSQRTARIALANFEEWFRHSTGEQWTLENWTVLATHQLHSSPRSIRIGFPLSLKNCIGTALTVYAVPVAGNWTRSTGSSPPLLAPPNQPFVLVHSPPSLCVDEFAVHYLHGIRTVHIITGQ